MSKKPIQSEEEKQTAAAAHFEKVQSDRAKYLDDALEKTEFKLKRAKYVRSALFVYEIIAILTLLFMVIYRILFDISSPAFDMATIITGLLLVFVVALNRAGSIESRLISYSVNRVLILEARRLIRSDGFMRDMGGEAVARIHERLRDDA